MSRVTVGLAGRAYDIVIAAGALDQLSDSLKALHDSGARKAFVILDTGIPGRFVDQLTGLITAAGLIPTIARVTPTERIKSIETYQSLLEQISSTGHSRVDPVIGFGGGIIGDLAGFVAASYRRGVPIIQCPTTLLSMVDASVGGKTGFNLEIQDENGQPKLLKNLIGAFWQPSAVIADIATLDSLDQRHRRSGLSECIKHGYIAEGVGCPGHLDWMIQNLDALASFDQAAITELVERNVTIKARVVELDEREDTSKAGGRMLLNFGHTFGHAIETLADLSPVAGDPSLAPLHHGEAIALGMIAACRAAESQSSLDPAIGDELCNLLIRIGLPTSVQGLPSNDQLIERMGHDKKATAGTLRLILPSSRGSCQVVCDAQLESLAAGFDAIRG